MTDNDDGRNSENEEDLPPPYYLAKLANHTGLTHEKLTSYHRAFMSAMDHDGPQGTGSGGKMDMIQFKKAIRSIPSVAKENDESLFKAVDGDGDGKVDFTDFVYAMRAANSDLLLDKLAWVLKLFHNEQGAQSIPGTQMESMVQNLSATLSYNVPSMDDVTGQAMSVLKSVAGIRSRDHQQSYSIPLLVAFLDRSSKV